MARLSGIIEISAMTLKFKIEGYKLVIDMLKKDNVASIPETAIILKPNLRPLDTIQVILPPSLSPSLSGICTAQINNIW